MAGLQIVSLQWMSAMHLLAGQEYEVINQATHLHLVINSTFPVTVVVGFSADGLATPAVITEAVKPGGLGMVWFEVTGFGFLVVLHAIYDPVLPFQHHLI